MSEKILFVDDERNILEAFERQLRKRFQIQTATGGEQGLLAIREQGPFAIVVADMRMPGMNGVEFLRKVRTESPATVRMMLTGNADKQTALEAVNEGHVFHFLTKPCSQEKLIHALDGGLDLYRLQGQIDQIRGFLREAA